MEFVRGKMCRWVKGFTVAPEHLGMNRYRLALLCHTALK